MTQLEKVLHPVKTHATSGGGLLSALLVVIIEATVSLTLTATVFALQPAPTGTHAQSVTKARAAKTNMTRKEITMTQTSATQLGSELTDDKTAIRPFHVKVPETELAELRRRIKATKWPEREQATDDSQGVQLDTIQKLARYWATE